MFISDIRVAFIHQRIQLYLLENVVETCTNYTLNLFPSMKRENQQDATIRCLLLTSVSTCFGHHYALIMPIFP